MSSTNPPLRLAAISAGFWRASHLRRALGFHGIEIVAPWAEADGVAVWGRRKVAARGRWLAARRNLPVFTLEDAPLRSLAPGDPWPVGFLLDRTGVYFDGRAPSDAEAAILTARADPERAARCIAALRDQHLSKYNLGDPAPLSPGAVLVVDQTAADASLLGAGRPDFLRMLAAARADHPDDDIYVLTHPEVASGRKSGHFRAADLDPKTRFVSGLTPWAALDGAKAVYCWSSQLGFEAILAGHRPHSFGWPIWAGWGLSEDRQHFPRRVRRSVAELFTGFYIDAPLWTDPFREAPTTFETVLRQLADRKTHHRRTRKGAILSGISPWKRSFLRRFFAGPVTFADGPRARAKGAASQRPVIMWGDRQTDGCQQMEDGFLRSLGLGAALIPPASLIIDDLGIHYDPSSESRLERLIADARPTARAGALRELLLRAGVSKYNLETGELPDLRARAGPRAIVLVPGQVENDASVRCGAPGLGNAELLPAARAQHPDAFLVYKPHPDVEAGLRPGQIAATEADFVAKDASPAALLDLCDAVVTLTSLMGFEALLRNKPVTCVGMPFYAGWGLTKDLSPPPARRIARPELDALVQAALIEYPLYCDPITSLGCGPEDIVARLASRDPRLSRRGFGHRTVSRLLPRLKRL